MFSSCHFTGSLTATSTSSAALESAKDAFVSTAEPYATACSTAGSPPTTPAMRSASCLRRMIAAASRRVARRAFERVAHSRSRRVRLFYFTKPSTRIARVPSFTVSSSTTAIAFPRSLPTRRLPLSPRVRAPRARRRARPRPQPPSRPSLFSNSRSPRPRARA